MSESLSGYSNELLRQILQQSRETLTAMVQALETKPEMQTPVRWQQTYSKFAVKDPDLMRVVLQASVAALVNRQSIATIEAEQRFRGCR